jgi:alkanesulfonate monooxygenase SsuD/methylene tetrahydromethanopterin reductase-like flavin-dependent oxidoreductase (luciferase family)
MSNDPRAIHFGYNPPSGNRLIERVEGATFVRDLGHVLDVASQHFDSLWVSDHFMTGDRFRMECWTELAWIAARYPGPQLGTIVMANSYRHPPLLAKMAASLQTFSHGRFILGYGAGWAEDEYIGYGIEFPPTRVRIEQMVEGIQAIRALWSASPANFEGRWYQLRDAYCEPRPDPPPPIMIGGDGERHLLRAVAEHADWWNELTKSTQVLRHKMDVLRAHCSDVGRDFDSIRKTYTLTIYLTESKSKSVAWAGKAMDREFPPFAGTPAELRDHILELNEIGFDLFQLVFAGFPETDDIALFVDEVLPAFR